MSLTFGSLFTGIGGIDLGFERAGWSCEWQVEIDEHAQKILQKHWPDVPRFGDIRTCGKHNLESVDLIAGGFPCQDVSLAGRRAGLAGARSGLWYEFARIIGEVRPRWVLVENVPGLLSADDGGAFGAVLRELAARGYDAWWDCVPASAVGAPHRRDRVWVVAYSAKLRCSTSEIQSRKHNEGTPKTPDSWGRARCAYGSSGRILRIPNGNFLRMADGIPPELDRYKRLGNAVVPQVAEWFARQIKTVEEI